MREPIACLGAGRMGRGIAVVFAYAGHNVTLVDLKTRDRASFERLSGDALNDVRTILGTLASFGLFDPVAIESLMTRVSVVPEGSA
jgi:3-hydroxybutyryl-CoA dehydrogenase